MSRYSLPLLCAFFCRRRAGLSLSIRAVGVTARFRLRFRSSEREAMLRPRVPRFGRVSTSFAASAVPGRFLVSDVLVCTGCTTAVAVVLRRHCDSKVYSNCRVPYSSHVEGQYGNWNALVRRCSFLFVSHV